LIDPVVGVVVFVDIDGEDFFPNIFVVDVGGEFGLSIVSSRRLFVLTPPKSYDCSILLFKCVS